VSTRAEIALRNLKKKKRARAVRDGNAPSCGGAPLMTRPAGNPLPEKQPVAADRPAELVSVCLTHVGHAAAGK